MRLLVFLFLIVGCWGDLRVLVDENGGYNIAVNNQIWLRSSRTAIYVDDQLYSTENNTLSLLGVTTAEGNDPYLGSWNETNFTYNIIRNQTFSSVVAHIRQWSIVPAITFHLETGGTALPSIIPLDMEQIRTVFPSFHIEKIDTNELGYFTFEGEIEFFYIVLF